MIKIDIHSESGYEITLKHYEPKSDFDTVVLIIPATGVKQSFYYRFANYLCSQNVAVFTFDYGGIGDSKKADLRSFDTTVANWGKFDLEAVMNHIKSLYDNKKLVAVAHSIGGQIIGLAPSSVDIDKIIFIAVQSGYWKYWKGFSRLKMLAAWYFLFPVFTNLYGYMPTSKISSMEDLPKSAAMQWREWCLSPNYLFDHLNGHKTWYDTIECPLISYSVENDAFGPKEAVDWLTSCFTSCDRKRIHINPADLDIEYIGHFGFFKESNSNTLWPILLKEIDD